MGSVIPGYKYDIFISYRQKDNKYDGWVTEFVGHLEKELEATFKEDISVYFDINPQDGLLDSHDVGDSLKNKLKCLVFIPIISRTYCDSNSFAWEHEFKAFVNQATTDKFGIKVKLQNGNVASRILPVQIYDLDPEDTSMCESILGGVLRSIEFIYKSAGVNRPLSSKEETPLENLNHTHYRDQINKVANAIKEIISSLKQDSHVSDVASNEPSKILTGNNKRKISGFFKYASVFTLLVIIALFLVPKLFTQSDNVEKSIAVLPFINDSPDQENTYFINGIMEEVLNNLQKIKDLRVLSRTSTEQYRSATRPSMPKIGKALDVNYIIEGSGQKYGNIVRLRVQLIESYSDKHLWAKSYEKEIIDPRDIFDIQNLIAESIAAELKAIITPAEKELIVKIPTASISAYDLYLKANDYKSDFLKTKDPGAFQTAATLYKTALETDSLFARAYSGLSSLYYERFFWEDYFKKDFIDTCFYLVDKALSLDDKLDEAYMLKGIYLATEGKVDEAIHYYDISIELNPNNSFAYQRKGYLLTWIKKDFIRGIENYKRSLKLVQGDNRSDLLFSLARVYIDIGLVEESKSCIREELAISNDSASYYAFMAWIELNLENFESALNLQKKAAEIDPTKYVGIDYYNCLPASYKDEIYSNALETIERLNSRNQLPLQWAHRIGYALWLAGKKKEADYYFNEQVKYGEESIKLNRNIAQKKSAQYDLAGTYAFLGQKEKAYRNLEDFGSMNTYPLWWISLIKNDPLFDKIRGEERFQNIQKKVVSKYQEEHEKVKKWLEGQDDL